MTPRHLSHRARRLIRFVGAATLLVLPVVAHSAAAPVPRFERADCLVDGEWTRDVRRECGWLVVQETRDGARPNTIRLAVEVFRATEPNGAPPLVLLHGGPGGRGAIRTFSEGVARTPILRRRDVVIYDQRGAGFSQPKLCPEYERAVRSVLYLRDGEEKNELLTKARRACIAELDANGIDRGAYSTAASAADLIDLRRTLGYASWDVMGESYGAYLAQEIMVRGGKAIRAVVLASPSARGLSVHAEQALSSQRAFERLFAACTAQPSCHAAFPDVEQDFYAMYDNLTRSPVSVTIARGDGRTDTIWVDGKRLVADIRDRMGPRRALAPIPLILHELRQGDRLRAARETVSDGSVPVGFADFALRALINCNDDQTNGPAYRKTLKSVNARARPPFRRSVDEDCKDWRPRSGAPASRAPVRSDIPTLITNGYFDSLVTSDHARRIATTLAHAYIVEFPDEGHSGPALGCHRAILAQFLADPTREPDTSCIASIPAIRFDTAWPPATSR